MKIRVTETPTFPIVVLAATDKHYCDRKIRSKQLPNLLCHAGKFKSLILVPVLTEPNNMFSRVSCTLIDCRYSYTCG